MQISRAEQTSMASRGAWPAGLRPQMEGGGKHWLVVNASQQAGLRRHTGAAGQQPACQRGQPAAHAARAAVTPDAAAGSPAARGGRGQAGGATQPGGGQASRCV